MSGHFIELCSKCGDVISQCRCMDVTKEKHYGICKKCEGNEEHEEETDTGC